jgi:hypothetical protein
VTPTDRAAEAVAQIARALRLYSHNPARVRLDMVEDIIAATIKAAIAEAVAVIHDYEHQ